MSSELKIGGYDLVGGGVAVYIFALIPKVFFLTFFSLTLSQSYYRPPEKSDFVKHINNVFTETGILDTHGQNVPPQSTSYLDFCFFFSLEQLIFILTRVTSKTATFTDHILTNCSQKVSQCGVIELGISDHDLVYCTRKTPLLKPNKHNNISVRSMENYSKEKVF